MTLTKSVCFDLKVRFQYLHVWSFAYQEARKSNWVLDRVRFEIRKQLLNEKLERCDFFSKKVKKMSMSWTIYIPKKIMNAKKII